MARNGLAACSLKSGAANVCRKAMGRQLRCIAPTPARTACTQHITQLTCCPAPLCAGATSSRRRKVAILSQAETTLNEA